MSTLSTLPVTPPTVTTPPVPHLRAVRPHPDAAPGEPAVPAGPVRPPVLTQLPEGATVLAALPQTVLPPQLLEQYTAAHGRHGGTPMVGYLVLVPADSVAPGAPHSAPAAVPEPAPGREQGITVDVEHRTARVDGVPLELTYLEFELLAHLTAHPHRVHSRDHLVAAVWGYGHVGDGRTVDVHVARLRRKLGAQHRESIVTVRRVGYKYTPVIRG
ncbi:winged helix-turn-helix domain-containing protein [Streptacidiphilus griseoplanus]|uniref:winged helix-turn-helix domain-containing protein n=1 Tax=Peterkaempfera griseoplana TaxID=66896 RepID=UPI0006E209DC|nr:winged helix-turn-helix domain-containing protein [Peterkaempfera griseoplana]